MVSVSVNSRIRGWRFCAVSSLLLATLASIALAQAPDEVVNAGGPSAEIDEPPVIDDGGVTRAAREDSSGLSLLWLIGQGGLLMVPIYLASIVAIAVIIERLISLRRSKVMPSGLIDALIPNGPDGALDPRNAYSLCQTNPSSAANVIRTMLLKVGRPHAEVERAVEEASEREANRMYANVRWLNLIAAVAPLIGLLGTVWGMIRAFFDTTQLSVGQNKADFLASGIYVALVTTLGGLAVAIPAAVFSHYFEGRIQRIIHQIEELLFQLLPHVERYEGRMRMNDIGTVGTQSLDKTDGPPSDSNGEEAGPPTAANRRKKVLTGESPRPKSATRTAVPTKESAPERTSPPASKSVSPSTQRRPRPGQGQA